jgi:hypothetical protein
VDTEFADALPDRLRIARVAIGKSGQAQGNRGAGALVLQPCAPFAERVGLLEFDHGPSVVQKLQVCQVLWAS